MGESTGSSKVGRHWLEDGVGDVLSGLEGTVGARWVVGVLRVSRRDCGVGEVRGLGVGVWLKLPKTSGACYR